MTWSIASPLTYTFRWYCAPLAQHKVAKLLCRLSFHIDLAQKPTRFKKRAKSAKKDRLVEVFDGTGIITYLPDHFGGGKRASLAPFRVCFECIFICWMIARRYIALPH